MATKTGLTSTLLPSGSVQWNFSVSEDSSFWGLLDKKQASSLMDLTTSNSAVVLKLMPSLRKSNLKLLKGKAQMNYLIRLTLIKLHNRVTCRIDTDAPITVL